MMAIPHGWHHRQFDEIATVQAGLVSPLKEPYKSQYHVGGENIASGGGLLKPLQTCSEIGLTSGKYRFIPGAIIYSKIRPNLNKVCIVDFEGVCSADAYPIYCRPEEIDAQFLLHSLRSPRFLQQAVATSVRSGMPKINREDLGCIEFLVPPLPEQRKIADILSTWDEALEKLDALIAAKDHRKQALMQQLLTGRNRVKGFDQSRGETKQDRFGIYPADWKRVAMGDIAREVGARNATGGDLPVLSCTKHRGLVLSQEYFGKRVHADDTSGYRIVKRGEFAYATNHIEEGSIGYQNLCDAGLVSPIYTVFKTTEAVDDDYLYRVLKSPLLIHFYQINTSASVDRRGSLRYGEFSKIHIWLPPKDEQVAITKILATADHELTLLRRQREALDQQKRGLMQRLLTGKIRVAVAP